VRGCKLRIQTAWRRRFLENNFEHHGGGIAGEGLLPNQHREKNNAQREDVRAGVNLATFHLFR
jgi:hypothetical protein